MLAKLQNEADIPRDFAYTHWRHSSDCMPDWQSQMWQVTTLTDVCGSLSNDCHMLLAHLKHAGQLALYHPMKYAGQLA